MNDIELQKTFCIQAVCREDLLNAGLDEALVWQLSDEDMIAIAEEIGDAVDQMVGDLIAQIASERQDTAIDEMHNEDL